MYIRSVLAFVILASGGSAQAAKASLAPDVKKAIKRLDASEPVKHVITRLLGLKIGEFQREHRAEPVVWVPVAAPGEPKRSALPVSLRLPGTARGRLVELTIQRGRLDNRGVVIAVRDQWDDRSGLVKDKPDQSYLVKGGRAKAIDEAARRKFWEEASAR